MMSDHSHNEWSLAWWVITRMIRTFTPLKYFVSYFKAISNANEQSILLLIIICMMSNHSHDEWSLAWWVITCMMSDHSHDDRHSHDNFHSHDKWSLAWWVITRMTSDHSHDEWSLAWWVITFIKHLWNIYCQKKIVFSWGALHAPVINV